MRGLPRDVREAITKARDSALLAVEVYNKPAVTFKSAAYIMLMVIAWTSLLQAVFYRRKIKPYYRKTNGRYERREGDYRHWELGECLAQLFGPDTGNPVRKNLEFFIPLRNKIEHRNLPELDSTIFGECQAMLLNFDEFISQEFGTKWCIRQCLSFALQMYPTSENLADAVKRNHGAQTAAEFIKQYRSSLDPGVYGSGKYAFKALLIQVANNRSKDSLAIQYVNYDMLTEDEKAKFSKIGALVKHKHVPVANADTIRAGVVCQRVQNALGDPKIKRGRKEISKYNICWHTMCWQHFKVRPLTQNGLPYQTQTQYCIYDQRHNDYGYTEAWVNMLIEKFRDGKLYDELCVKKDKSEDSGVSVG